MIANKAPGSRLIRNPTYLLACYQKTPVTLLLCLALTACSKDPAEQCLDSFKNTLKDPDSGRVISFENGRLQYSATNSYGARVQGNAICQQNDSGWTRDRMEERTQTLSRMAEILNANNACRSKAMAEGVANSIHICGRIDSSEKELTRRAEEELGFR